MSKDRASLRLREIVAMLAEQDEVTVGELAERFAVTTMTIRRDLETLAGQGRVVRTHGGAILAAPSVARFAFQERQQTQLLQKRAIAQATVALIAPGMTLVLDTGTTTLEVARALGGVSGLRVLTSSLAIASALFGQEGVELILLGGSVSCGSPDLSGSLTVDNLARFQVDLAIVGADAVDRRGLYTASPAIADVSRAMIASARESILVADSSKFGHSAFVRFGTWARLGRVVVDNGLAAPHRRWLRSVVGDMITADV